MWLFTKPIPLNTPQDHYDAQLMDPQDPVSVWKFGRRLNAGSVLLNQFIEQERVETWLIELARAWAEVDYGVIFRALMEDWTVDQACDYLGIKMPQDAGETTGI